MLRPLGEQGQKKEQESGLKEQGSSRERGRCGGAAGRGAGMGSRGAGKEKGAGLGEQQGEGRWCGTGSEGRLGDFLENIECEAKKDWQDS